MEILKCYEGGGDKEKATKWDEISHAAGGNTRTAVGLFGSFYFLCCSFRVLYGRTKFQSRPVCSQKFSLIFHLLCRTVFLDTFYLKKLNISTFFLGVA